MNIRKTLLNDINTVFCGGSCLFVPLTSKWAIKAFSRKAIRDKCFNMQRRAAQHGLGPEARSFLFEFDLDISDHFDDNLFHEDFVWSDDYMGTFYCYITEIVEPVSDQLDENEWDCDAVDNWFTDTYQDEIDEACLVLHETLDFPFFDNHVFNWGWKRDKLIPLDFGA